MHARAAWAAWALGSVAFFYAFFQRTAPSVFLGALQTEFGLDAGQVGALTATYFYS